MGMQIETNSNENVGDSYPSGGTQYGQAAADLIAFYGAAPIVQPTAAAQAAITNSAGGTASPTTGLQALTSSYNSGILSNSIATIVAQTNAIQAVLVNLGLMKGS